MGRLFAIKFPRGRNNPIRIPSWKTCFDHGGSGRRRTSRVSASTSAPYQTADLSQLFYGSPIAIGAHSHVYHGKYKGQDVALKVIKSSEGSESIRAGLEKHFSQEVTILSRLNHPNIVKFIAAYTQNGAHCIITEYLSEGSLRAHLNKQHQRGLPLEKSISFALDIARGMEYLHSQGIIHRDLKPQNILIDGGSLRMKIADFGICCVEGEDDDGEVGSYRWMAPEMIRLKACGRKVDVYSFGLLFSEMVSGRIPFERLSPPQAAWAVINRNLRPPLPEECPPAMRALIEWCWASKHKRRPEFWQIVKVLEGFKSSLARDGTLQLVDELGSVYQYHKKGFLHKILKLGCVTL